MSLGVCFNKLVVTVMVSVT